MTAHPTNDPTNPLHRLADDAKRFASGAYPAKLADLHGIAGDINATLDAHAKLAAALAKIAEGTAPIAWNGHYLAHREAVKIAREALS